MKNIDDLMEVLYDVKENGKEQSWKDYKVGSRYLSESYKRLGIENKSCRVFNCATELVFTPRSGGGIKLIAGHFCQVPLCPMCAMRRTRKIFGQVSKIMSYIDRHEKYRYIFLTLTMKNVKGAELIDAMDKLMVGFHVLIHHVKFKSLSKGWFRAMEITHNWKTDEYHPHFHMVIAVDEKYFNRRENYLTHEDWKCEWQKCMGLGYEPFVRIQRVRKDHDQVRVGETGYWKAVAEISKYTAKSMDYMVMWEDRKRFERKIKVKIKSREQCYAMTDSAVSVLDEAIYKRRLVAFGGRLKEVHKRLNLDDPEKGDLVNTDNEDELYKEFSDVILRYRWCVGLGDYVLVRDEK